MSEEAPTPFSSSAASEAERKIALIEAAVERASGRARIVLAEALRRLVALAAPSRSPVTARLVWVVANNRKTGPILTSYVFPHSAAVKTCAGCALFTRVAGRRCYSWGRRAEMRLKVMERWIAEGRKSLDEYSLGRLLATAKGRRAVAIRLTAIGDASRIDRNELRAVLMVARARGLA